ncbi:MAG: DNA mismatch repair protein MutS [Bacilli bacterium]|nr:DNA mismatch repair protein MutS [Bacilli bacterium]
MKRNEVNKNDLSPMMRQYMDIKDQYPNELVFYRVGDFYELFFEDGETASRELELTLTGKNAGLSERVPMCGVPFHSVTPYIEKLVTKGFKVAICEQLEDPKDTKNMVKRGVTQVISKGTVVDPDLLSIHDNHYIASLIDYNFLYVLCYADISTGSISVMGLPHIKEKLISEILNLGILEIILQDNTDLELIGLLKGTYGIDVSIEENKLEDQYLELYDNLNDEHFKESVKHLLYYLVIRELKDLSHMKAVEVVYPDDYLEMDVHTVRNLELVETLRLKERNFSLIWLLDKCKTSMGSRKLKNWLMNPLKKKELIENRYDKIDIFNNEFIIKDRLRNALYEVYDIERICGKVACGNLNARDLLQLKNSLKVLPEIKEMINELKFDYKINTHEDIYNLLEQAIYENPPVTIKEGYLIKEGYNQNLDELKEIRSGGKTFIADFESKLKESTGIKTLKVGYNKVFGYYIEVSKGQVKEVSPDLHWERRQTLTNCERYISPELKEKEALILNAEEKIIDLEYNLFLEIKAIIKDNLLKLKDTAEILSELDALSSLSVCSEEYHFVRPTLNKEHIIEIKNGRHPVVEKVSNLEYVSNNCIMDPSINTLLITGPNMSGKSTYMRQLAIIIILAQMGSFVPAESANIPIIDKIFTRIGASDDLVSGESTFMVEMKEAKNAICGATIDSLILFDELGRGTATYDGMSLAQSILEYISKNIKCKTLFSTHYHELTSLEHKIPSIKNVHVSAHEENGNITFLHKIKNGAVDKSYGIHVAKLAGMPTELLTRADEILNYYETESKQKQKKSSDDNIQLTMAFEEEKKDNLKEKLEKIDPLRLTPIEALNILYELKELSTK